MSHFAIDTEHQAAPRFRFASLAVLAILMAIWTTAFFPAGIQVARALQRGTLVSATPLTELDAGQVTASLEEIGVDASRVRFGVEAHQIVYHTVDPEGLPITASGLVVFPGNDDRDLRLVAWLHGTRVNRGEVASVSADSDDWRFAFAFASAGYAVSVPDYLGLGLGPGFHPWMDASSLATVAVDALRATRELAARDERRLDDRVLVSGFSEGGNAAMALGQALHNDADPHLQLGALAPISGGHGWSAWVRSAVSGEIDPGAATVYLAYLSVAWNRLHHLYDSPIEAFRAPYDGTVETLFDNDHTIEQIFSGLPATPEELLAPPFAERLRHPSGTLRQALQEADSVCDWQPDVPVHLYAANGDHEMPIDSAIHCQQALQAHGADVTLIDVGDVDHFGSVVLSLPRVLAQFETIGG